MPVLLRVRKGNKSFDFAKCRFLFVGGFAVFEEFYFFDVATHVPELAIPNEAIVCATGHIGVATCGIVGEGG